MRQANDFQRLQVPVLVSTTTSGKQLSVVYAGNCTTTRIYYAERRDASAFRKQISDGLNIEA